MHKQESGKGRLFCLHLVNNDLQTYDFAAPLNKLFFKDIFRTYQVTSVGFEVMHLHKPVSVSWM